jgi:hypothetical protein
MKSLIIFTFNLDVDETVILKHILKTFGGDWIYMAQDTDHSYSLRTQ